MTDHQKVDIGILLDKCGINYTEEQLEKLEKLLENFGVFCKIETNFSQYGEELIKVEASIAGETFSEVVQEISRDSLEIFDLNNEDSNTEQDEIADNLGEQCSSCQKSFKSLRMLEKHIARGCCGTENLCQHCGKVFQKPEQLRTHLRYNHKERQVTCNICKHKFHSNRDLTRHINSVHEGKKEVQCGTCGKFFTCSNTLKTHERCVHLKLKLYKCEQCQKSFTLADTLKKHKIWAHSNDRPFVCQVCGKGAHLLFLETKLFSKWMDVFNVQSTFSVLGFPLKTQLSNHVKVVHDKIRRFECSTCHMKFGQKTTLDKHVARIHEKQKHSCQSCGKSWSW